MNFKISVAKDIAAIKADCLVLGSFSDQKKWPESVPAILAKQLDSLRRSGDLNTAAGQSLWLYHPEGVSSSRLLVVDCGKCERWDAAAYREFVLRCASSLQQGPAKSAAIILPQDVPAQSQLWQASQLAKTITAATYRYDATRSKPEPAAKLQTVTLVRSSKNGQAELKKGLSEGYAIGKGLVTAKELGDLPGNICTPEYLAQRARNLARGQ